MKKKEVSFTLNPRTDEKKEQSQTQSKSLAAWTIDEIERGSKFFSPSRQFAVARVMKIFRLINDSLGGKEKVEKLDLLGKVIV